MNTIRKTYPGHWADQTTQFADLRAGVSHRQEERPFTFAQGEAGYCSEWSDWWTWGVAIVAVAACAALGLYFGAKP